MSELGRLLGINSDARIFKQDSRLVLPDCRIGVECEFEGVRKDLPPEPESRYWTPHAEGSLRNNGQEWVFSEPLFGTDAYNAVKWILNKAKVNGYQTSIRTGLHVHVDARDMTAAQFKNLCALYAYIEPVLFAWVGDNREESVYCVPWYYADKSLLKAGAILKACVADSLKEEKEGAQVRPVATRPARMRLEEDDEPKPSDTARLSKDYERYAAFNLNALHKFGSVEYRHMQMTLDFERTMDWINLVLSLKKAALEPGDMYAKIMKYTPIDFFNLVFGTRLFSLLFESCKGKFKEKVALGSQSCTDLMQVIRPFSWAPNVPHQLVGKSRGAEKFQALLSKQSKKEKLVIDPLLPPLEYFPDPAQLIRGYNQYIGLATNPTTYGVLTGNGQADQDFNTLLGTR